MNEHPIYEAGLELLADGRPMLIEELVDALVASTDLGELAAAEGITPEDYLEEIRPLEDLIWDEGDHVIRLDTRIDRVVLTHRLTAEEIETDELTAYPDLGLFDFDSNEVRTADGVELTTERWDTWVGPPGWLSAFEPGDLIAVRRSNRRLSLEAIESTSDGDREAQALENAWIAERRDENKLVALGTLVTWTIATDPDAFSRPVPPIDDLVERIGLERVDEWVGLPGSHFPDLGSDPDDPEGDEFDLEQDIAEAYDLDACCQDALGTVLLALAGHPGDLDAVAVGRSLGHGAVAPAFASWVDAVLGLDDEGVEAFIHDVIRRGRSHAAPALYVLSKLAAAASDPVAAERHLDEALRRDPEYWPALEALAGYRIDRSDPRALSLLLRAGLPDDHPSVVVARALSGTPIEAGRNDRCPCGSGRKFKQCHLGKPIMSPGDRVRLLIAKAARFVDGSEEAMLTVAALAAAGVPEDVLISMGEDPFVHDVLMFEGGGLAAYLDARDELLPDSEVDVYEMWEDTPLSVWEVVESDGVSQTVLLDMRSAERITVEDHAMAANYGPGEQFLGRYLPYDERFWSTGAGIVLGPGLTSSALELVDADPIDVEILEWYARLLLPPRMETTEGEPFTVSTATLAPIGDWDRLGATLDKLYERKDEDASWVENHENPAGDLILRASLRRQGDHLIVETNSDRRLDRVIVALTGVTSVIERSSKPLSEVMSEYTPRGDTAGSEQVELPDDVMEEMRRQMAERWLSESIPALGGLTPAEAALDPTRRGDLLALLRSFDDRYARHENAITMDIDLVRERLGLSES